MTSPSYKVTQIDSKFAHNLIKHYPIIVPTQIWCKYGFNDGQTNGDVFFKA